MGSKIDTRRRWLGGIFLVVALGMLVVGETVLQHRLSAKAFLVYWMVCFVFTGGAMLVAFRDVMMQQRRARELQRELLEDTLREIVEKQKNKARQNSSRQSQED